MKNKNTYIDVLATFGSIKQYKLFAVKSSQNIVPFTASFDRIISGKFNYLTDFIAAPNQFSAHFSVMYALLSKEETGKEEDILVILNSDEGTLTM